MGHKLYVFTAGNQEARKHLHDTIENPIDFNEIEEFFGNDDKEQLRRIDKENRLYAWGAIPGKNNTKLWEKLNPGDYVLCVYDNTYHYIAKVLYKVRNKQCAEKLWGHDPKGQTWELMYFLSKPEKIEIPISRLSCYLNKRYMGFTKISEDKIRSIKEEFGDIEKFVKQVLLDRKGEALEKDEKQVKSKVWEEGNDKSKKLEEVEKIISYIKSKGFIYEPWQIAQYITAIRTKPFVILAGISGTGKSKLPALVAEATGGESRLIPVRPDWTDSSDILGYVDLQGDFRPGSLLEAAHEAMCDQEKFWICIIDEMNLSRVEHYFAEILSKIEDRDGNPQSGYKSKPLLGKSLKETDSEWANVVLPPNFCIVGTVNMDESSHGFSRKVLDRAFTIEFSEVELDTLNLDTKGAVETAIDWPPKKWFPKAIRLAELMKDIDEKDKNEVIKAVEALKEINALLTPAQLQIGYRTRDEIALFLIHAKDIQDSFRETNGENVDPLDLAFQMKILPRIVGGSAVIQEVVLGLLGWAVNGTPFKAEEDGRPTLENWKDEGRPTKIPRTRYPRLAARLCLMWERLLAEGYTSYWL